MITFVSILDLLTVYTMFVLFLDNLETIGLQNRFYHPVANGNLLNKDLMNYTIAPILSPTIIHGNITIDTLDIPFNFDCVFQFKLYGE